VGENEREGEAADDHYGRDEPPKVERTRSIFERGEFIGTAMREQGVG